MRQERAARVLSGVRGNMATDDARPTGILTHLPSDSGTAFGPSRSTR